MPSSNATTFVVYSAAIDEFVKIRHLSTEELAKIINRLGVLVRKPGIKINDYVQYLVGSCVLDYKSYDYVEHAESLFSCVTDVYPIFQIEIACRTVNEIGSFDGLPTPEKNPTMTLKTVESLSKKLKKNLIGQDAAIDECINAIKLIASGMGTFISLFFIGPTGVGKTELARLLASQYLKDPNKLVKINCSEYANGHEYAKLVGSPPGYIGHTEKGILADKAEESSQWIILFDEIEKAHPKLINLLLGLLDDGVIVDNQGVELDFRDSLIVFTSNVGIKDNVGRVNMGFGKDIKSYEASKEDICKAFKEEFNPEFINRLGSVVYFNSLSLEDAIKIAHLNLKKLPVHVTKPLANYVANNSFSVEYGARNINRYIRDEITLKIADKILESGKKGSYKITIKNGDTLIVNDV